MSRKKRLLEDPIAPTTKDRTKIMAYVSPKLLIDLKIRLQYDQLSMSEFLRHAVFGYVNGDTRIVEFVRDTKKLLARGSEDKRSKSEELIKEGKNIEDAFGLSENDKSFLYDLFEKEL